jgi:hypothetical protein
MNYNPQPTSTKDINMTTSAKKKAAPKKRGSYDFSASNNKSANETKKTANKTLGRGAKVMRGAFAEVASNARQMQEKAGNLSKEISGNLAQGASKAAQNANRAVEMHRANTQAAAQSYNAASTAAKKTGQEIFNYVNDMFAQNVEAARAALECRNVSEFFELQNEIARQNIEAGFERALRISELAIKTATQAMEPINETVARNSKKLSEFTK